MSIAGRVPFPSMPRRKCGNPVLIPGNLLAHSRAWQIVAGRLPPHAVLIVLPEHDTIQKATLLRVARLLAQHGRRVQVVSASAIVRSER